MRATVTHPIDIQTECIVGPGTDLESLCLRKFGCTDVKVQDVSGCSGAKTVDAQKDGTCVQPFLPKEFKFSNQIYPLFLRSAMEPRKEKKKSKILTR